MLKLLYMTKTENTLKDYRKLTTEQSNKASEQIDRMSAYEIAKLINEEDQKVALAVERSLDEIAKAIDWLCETLKRDGRVFYCGAGTSGRLGALDASEILPTYGLDNRIIGLMAGGSGALARAKEDLEDNPDAFAEPLENEFHFNDKDILVAVSASGASECVAGAIRFAHEKGAKVICVTCNQKSDLIPLSDLAIVADVGPEVILGSTRMKAGTAQKMILNMLSTGAMIRYGRVRGNKMAYLRPTNQKLVARAARIIQEETGCPADEAERALAACGMVAADAIDNIRSGIHF